MTAPNVAPGMENASSIPSLRSDKSSNETLGHTAPTSHEESAIPEDKKEELLENLEDNWESDPENARNWSAYKKWVAVSIVMSNIHESLRAHRPCL